VWKETRVRARVLYERSLRGKESYKASDGSGESDRGWYSPCFKWWKAPAAAIMAALSVQ